MTSTLVLLSAEQLQDRIIATVKSKKNKPGVFVSLNKSQKSTQELLQHHGIDTSHLFYIDCISGEKSDKDVLNIEPEKLGLLNTAIHSYIDEIQGPKFIIIDSLATLLIYNKEMLVAEFIHDITQYSHHKQLEIFAFSPKTRGKALLETIFNFFDKVKKK